MVSADNQSSTIMYTVRDLQPGQAYQFVVTAENEAGEGPPSQPSSVLTIPEECLYLFLFDFIYHTTLFQRIVPVLAVASLSEWKSIVCLSVRKLHGDSPHPTHPCKKIISVTADTHFSPH